MRKGLTLGELIITVVILGILASIAYPLYTKAMERSKDREAITNLRLIKAAEAVYHAENVNYYGPDVGPANEVSINTNLHIQLPLAANSGWDYDITIAGVNNFTAIVTRTCPATACGRVITITESTEPACAGCI